MYIIMDVIKKYSTLNKYLPSCLIELTLEYMYYGIIVEKPEYKTCRGCKNQIPSNDFFGGWTYCSQCLTL